MSDSPGWHPASRRAAGLVSFSRDQRRGRSTSGGARYEIHRGAQPPFDERGDCDLVLRDLAALIAMPSAGDLIIYGTGAPEGNVSYIAETGGHAGPSPDELQTFIVAPAHVDVPTITHPIELYALFIAYQETFAPAHRREL